MVGARPSMPDTLDVYKLLALAELEGWGVGWRSRTSVREKRN